MAYFLKMKPVPEADISWDVLRRIVRDWAGADAALDEVRPLAGGMVNTTLLLKTADNSRAVVKISPHLVNRKLVREAAQLELLRQIGLPTPRVFQVHLASLDHPYSFVLMEFVEGVDLNTARRRCSAEQFDALQRQLAEMVLAMHLRTSDAYGRVSDGEEHHSSWPDFYRALCDPILEETAASAALPADARRKIERLHRRLDRLVAHDDCPRLVHWDIWSANVLARPDDTGNWRIAAILDPNCRYAHAEAELAYMELFRTITPAFLETYQRQLKISTDYRRIRRPVYQLYSLLDHVRLFGKQYLPPLLATLEECAPLI